MFRWDGPWEGIGRVVLAGPEDRTGVPDQGLTIRCEQAQAREKVLRAEKTDWKAQARGAQGIQKQTSRKLEETRKVLKEERKTAKKAPK